MNSDEFEAQRTFSHSSGISRWPKFSESSIYESIVIATTDHLEIDVGMARAVFLSAIATVVQNAVDVEKPNGHHMPTSLYVVVAGESGLGKTPVQEAAFRPIQEFQTIKMNDHLEKIEIYNLIKSNFEIAYKELEKCYRHAIKQGISTDDIELRQLALIKTKPKPPVQPRFIYEDITPSALAYNLYKNVPFGCLASSEADGVFNGKVMQDMTLFNSIWSGSSITVDRKTSEDFSVEHPRCSASLMLQPGRLQNFLKNRGNEAKSNGFLARLLVMQAESTVGTRTRDTTPPNKETVARYTQRCADLLTLSFDSLESGNTKRIVKFSASAKSLWKNLNLSVEREMLEHGKYFHAKDHASKLMDNVSRVAAILHTFEGYQGDIETQTLDYAYQTCRQFSQHYLELIAGTPEIAILTNQLVKDIRRFGINQNSDYIFSDSTISQRGHNSLRSKPERQAAIKLLTQLGHLTKRSSSQYTFKNTIIGLVEPELKNGVDYYIDDLLFYENQRFSHPYGYYEI